MCLHLKQYIRRGQYELCLPRPPTRTQVWAGTFGGPWRARASRPALLGRPGDVKMLTQYLHVDAGMEAADVDPGGSSDPVVCRRARG